MKKILRISAWVVAALVAVVVVGVAVLYAVFDGARIQRELAEAVQTRYQRTLTMEGDVGLSVWPNIALTLGPTRLTEPRSDAVFAAVQRARISVAAWPLLSKRVAVNALELDGLKLSLVQRADGRLNADDLLAARKDPEAPQDDAAAGAAPLRVDVSAIAVRGAELSWLDEKTGQRSVLSNLDVETGRIALDSVAQHYSVQQLRVAAQGKRGADTFNVQLLVPGVQGAEGVLKLDEVDLSWDATVGSTQAKGQLRTPVAVQLAQQQLSLPSLRGQLDVTHPGLPMQRVKLPLSGSAQVNWGQSQAQLNVATQLDASKIQLQAQVSRFSPLALGFGLTINQLNVDQYLPPKPAAAVDSTPAAKTGAPAASPLPYAALQGLNLNGKVQIGALQVSGIALQNLQATVQASGGQLQIAPLSAQLYQGSVQGSVQVNAASQSLALKQTLSGVQLGPLLKAVANYDALEGRANVALDVRAQGPHTAALKKTLAGSATVNIKDGAIKGINLAKSLRQFKAQFTGRTDAVQQANKTEKTDFSELSASFKIANGVARNDDLQMKSPFIRLGGAGVIDIGNSQIDYLAKATVVNNAVGQDGLGLDQLKGLTIPVRLRGPFTQLSYQLEFGSMVEDAIKAKVQTQVEEKKQEIQKKVEDSLRDSLKGLFGR